MINITNQIIRGDCIDILRQLSAESVNCCVTSPPYWGLRDYGVEGQLGLEATPEEYTSKLVEIFREVRRVLKNDGTLWLNLGDTYATDTKGGEKAHLGDKSFTNRGGLNIPRFKLNHGLKPKDLVGIPWRVAFALQSDGWWLRNDIIWHKLNPMPESITDRLCRSHEYIFLMAKSRKYYFDAAAIREPVAESTLNDKRNGTGRHTQGKKYSKYFNAGPTNPARPDLPSWYRGKVFVDPAKGRNKRSVWTTAIKPFRGAHFATFSPDLIKPCVLAGCPPNGIVLDPFMGVGTVAIVALMTGRKYLGIEISPEYIAMAQKRIDNYLKQGQLFD